MFYFLYSRAKIQTIIPDRGTDPENLFENPEIDFSISGLNKIMRELFVKNLPEVMGFCDLRKGCGKNTSHFILSRMLGLFNNYQIWSTLL